MDLKFELQTDSKIFHSIKPEWNNLLENSKSNNVFLTWEWIKTWWDIYGKNYKLFLITVRDAKGRLLAIAPFKSANRKMIFGKVSILEFIGCGEKITPEYLDIIIHSDYEDYIIPKLFKFLDDFDFDAFEFSTLPAHSKTFFFITKYSKDNILYPVIKNISTCPIAELPDSWLKFISHKSQNFRKKMGEIHRRLEKEFNIKFCKCDSSDDLDFYFDGFIGLHGKRWDGISNAFDDEQYILFHKRLSELFLLNGWLRLFLLQNSKGPMAGIYCYYYDKNYYYYQSGRDPVYSKYSIGLAMMNITIEEAIKEGTVCFDFLTGDENYKFRWANSIRSNYTITCWKNHNYYVAQSIYAKSRKFMSRPLSHAPALIP
jgi:CelD/BcsL family acetyltransferase involved in cellulose biosynthesis